MIGGNLIVHKAKAAVWQMALQRIMLGNEFYAIRLHRIDAHTLLDQQSLTAGAPAESLLPRFYSDYREPCGS